MNYDLIKIIYIIIMNTGSLIIFAIVLAAVLADLPKHVCPKYTCEKGTDTSCALLKAGITTDGFNKISLTDICRAGEEYCDVPFPAWNILADVDKDTTYTCKSKSTVAVKRFPGEACEKAEDCVKTEEGTGTLH
jgi:hypothetical protein